MNDPRNGASDASDGVTTWLELWRDGDPGAIEQVTALVYQDLRRLAAYHLKSESSVTNLQATALVHEAFLRMSSVRSVDWRDRAHFISVVTTIVRRILVDHARARKAAKREISPPHRLPAAPEHHQLDTLAVDEALLRLSGPLSALRAGGRTALFRRPGSLRDRPDHGHVAGSSGAGLALCSCVAKKGDGMNATDGQTLQHIFDQAIKVSPEKRADSTDGSVLYSSGDLHAAGLAYQRAIGLRQDIAKASPQDVQSQLALATCLQHMGDLSGGFGFTSLGDTAAALTYYEQAKTLVATLTTQFPGNLDVTKESYKTLLSLSASEGSTGRHEEAASDLALALTQIAQVSAALPNDTFVKIESAIGESHLGQMLLDARQADAAAERFTRAYVLLQLLSQADPENVIFRQGESIVESQWGAALLVAGHPAKAVAHSEQGLRLAEALSMDAPQSSQYRIDVGVSLRKLSESLLANADAGAVREHAVQAVQGLCPADPARTNANTMINCGRAHLANGNANVRLHNSGAAQQDLREAIKIAAAQSQADPHNAVLRSDDARAKAAMAVVPAQSGDLQNARSMYQDPVDECQCCVGQNPSLRKICTDSMKRLSLSRGSGSDANPIVSAPIDGVVLQDFDPRRSHSGRLDRQAVLSVRMAAW